MAVLKLMDRALVLGVTEQGVQLLAETELAPLEEALTAEAPARHRRAGQLRAAQSIAVDAETLAALEVGSEPVDGTRLAAPVPPAGVAGQTSAGARPRPWTVPSCRLRPGSSWSVRPGI